MWGFSLEDLAKRAQEEASRIAEQASHMQSPNLFNLDDMQSNDDHQDEEEQQIGTASSAPIITTGNGDLHDSTPMRHQQQMEEEAEATNNVEAPNTTTTPKVTKLQVSSGDDDDFNFDAWGEDEIDITEDNTNKDDSDETAERMRLESQKLAQQIMEEEQKRIMEEEQRLQRAEEEEQQQREAERIKREKMLHEQEEEMERQRLRKLEEEEAARRLKEQQRLEQEQRERQAAEEAQAAEEKRLKKLREEEERLRLEEETKFIEAQKRMELERRQAQEEAQAAEEQRLREEEEQERLRLKEEAAAEDEANRLEEEKVQAEKERLLQEEEEQERLRLEEEQRLLEEQKRLESEREAQKGAAAEEKERREEEERDRLRLEEEAKLLEVKRLEEQRQAEEDSRIAEEERQRMIQKEEEEREQERLRVEEDVNRSQEQQRMEQEAVELGKSEDSALADEINDEIGDDAWSDQSEEIEGDDEIFSSESADRQAQSHTEVEENSENVSVAIDAPYTVEHADANALNDHEVSQPNSESLELQDSLPPIDAQGSYRDNNSDVNVVQQNNTASSAEKPPDNTFFGAAAADLASSMFENQATNLFNEASKSASMFSWGKSSAEDDATPPASAATNVEAETEDEPNSEDGLYNDDDLDAMYDDDDDESDDSETHDETDSQKLGTVQNGDNGETLGIKLEMEGRMPSNSAQHTVEDFVKQLERMSESHQLEMNEMQRSHQLEMEALQHELSLERDKKEKDKARKEVASQDKFLSQMRELEKKFNTDLKEKDDELQNVMQRNEGMRLKMDSIKREVDGLIKLVDERDDEIATLKQGHGKSMVQVEGKVKYSEEALARKDAKISELNASVSSLQADLDSTTEAYHTLKERAKSVATELKDRRVEVRTLTSQNQEFSSSKTLQETQLVNLRAVVNQHELTIGYKDKDMDALNAKVKELEKQIEGKEKSIQDSSAVGEKAISSYKRKAQEALAAANSRLALSNQAREEAESEAKAAKSTSDDAVTRARDAELKMSEAEQRANAATSLLDELKLSSSGEINELNDTVDNLRSTIDTMQKEAKEDSNERERLDVEMGHLKTNLVEVKKKESELREKLIEQQALCTSLQKEVHDLNDEVQRNSAAAFKRANDEEAHSNNFAERNSSVLSMDANGSSKARDREEADGTIIMLQQELYGANEAIADLKLALRTALLEKTDGDSRDNIPGRNNEVFAGDSPHGNDSTPLFYAIEKQNELNTARDEINRLANMLGDAEAEKQEAYDIMEDMRHKMEDANARLLRYEKLGMKGARPHQHVSQSNYGPFRNTSQSSGITSDNNLSSSGNDSVVNLEYLKNVMLSYLKAKTLADRRKLVPVIATVLCLTPEEQAQAVNSVEDSAGLSGVAVSFWENLESKAHNLM
ncbi:GRIP and coiled-coil domain-containing protein [Skeletonema marinoi]|uniref:GRIP and coiled-coil domain-containing protein n=2 Tax=Skeletonema marinoi TaxID=267567 RepID=A0AAD8YC86_9STRA|nr:GRIP and coiled-coil domain-containing protein [Skeletonema marinoi]